MICAPLSPGWPALCNSACSFPRLAAGLYRNSYACSSTQVFLAMLVSRFRLHLAPSMGSPQDAMSSILYHLTFTRVGGLWMTAEPR